MDRLLTRVNDIADSARTPGEKVMAYTVAIFDTEITKLIRNEPDPMKALREAGFVDIAWAIEDLLP